MASYPEELEADFRQFYGLDLGELGITYSVGHGAVLAAQLPPGSRVLRAIDPDAAWRPGEFILARLTNTVEAFAFAMARSNGGKGRPPQPIRTPRQTHVRPAPSMREEVDRILGR